MNGKITLFTKILLDFMYYTGIAVTVLVPAIITAYGRVNSYFGRNIPWLSIIFIAKRLLYPGKCEESEQNGNLQLPDCSDHLLPPLSVYHPRRRHCDSGLRDRRPSVQGSLPGF